jgi:hypothetical protein
MDHLQQGAAIKFSVLLCLRCHLSLLTAYLQAFWIAIATILLQYSSRQQTVHRGKLYNRSVRAYIVRTKQFLYKNVARVISLGMSMAGDGDIALNSNLVLRYLFLKRYSVVTTLA